VTVGYWMFAALNNVTPSVTQSYLSADPTVTFINSVSISVSVLISPFPLRLWVWTLVRLSSWLISNESRDSGHPAGHVPSDGTLVSYGQRNWNQEASSRTYDNQSLSFQSNVVIWQRDLSKQCPYRAFSFLNIPRCLKWIQFTIKIPE